METQTTIQLVRLATGYGKKTVTRNISAALHAGEFTCLLGVNGAGKSTLLKTMCAFQPPLSGEIILNGTELSKISPRQLARTIGVVLTERPATINMTVQELVGLGRSPYTSFFGGLREDDRQIVAEALQVVGIQDLAHRSVATLSDGERQKAFIAKVIAQQTSIIILDEPTAFLDFPSKVEIMKLLYKIAKQEGKTIFMSTHDVELALQLADTVWLLDRKQGLRMGTPAALACEGSIASYFQRPGLAFNPDTLDFSIEK